MSGTHDQRGTEGGPFRGTHAYRNESRRKKDQGKRGDDLH